MTAFFIALLLLKFQSAVAGSPGEAFPTVDQAAVRKIETDLLKGFKACYLRNIGNDIDAPLARRSCVEFLSKSPTANSEQKLALNQVLANLRDV